MEVGDWRQPCAWLFLQSGGCCFQSRSVGIVIAHALLVRPFPKCLRRQTWVRRHTPQANLCGAVLNLVTGDFMHLDWTHLLTAGIGSGLTLFIRYGVFLLLRTPANVLLGKQWFIRIASKVWPKHPDLSGNWMIEWRVESNHFPEQNIDTATLYKFFHIVSAQISSTTTEGRVRKYGFLGKRNGGFITGEWFDTVGGQEGYYGVYQLTISPDFGSASGMWVGFSRTSKIKSGDLIWTKC